MVWILFQHILENHLGHSAENNIFFPRKLIASDRSPHRIEDFLGSIENNGGIKKIGMTDGLAIQQKTLWISQKSIFPGQVPEITGTVKEFCWRNIFWDIQRYSTMRYNYFAGCTCRHILLTLGVYEKDGEMSTAGKLKER
jgi:hypothetical protein